MPITYSLRCSQTSSRKQGSMSTIRGSAHGGSGPAISRTERSTSGGGGSSLSASARSRRYFSTEESWEVSLGSKSTSKEFPGFDRIFSLGESGSRRAFVGRINLTSDETFG